MKGDTLRARDNMKCALGLALEENDSMIVSMTNHNLSCTYEEVDSMLFTGNSLWRLVKEWLPRQQLW